MFYLLFFSRLNVTRLDCEYVKPQVTTDKYKDVVQKQLLVYISASSLQKCAMVLSDTL
jgi:hypothetical protein